MRLLILAPVAIILTVIAIGLMRGWIITWGSFSDAELEEMGVKFGRKEFDGDND